MAPSYPFNVISFVLNQHFQTSRFVGWGNVDTHPAVVDPRKLLSFPASIAGARWSICYQTLIDIEDPEVGNAIRWSTVLTFAGVFNRTVSVFVFAIFLAMARIPIG